MTDLLKRIGKVVPSALAVITVHSYYITLKDDSAKKMLDKVLNENKNLNNTVKTLMENNTLNEAEKAEFIKTANQSLNSLQEILDKIKKINSINSGDSSTVQIQNRTFAETSEIFKAINEGNESVNNLSDLINKLGKRGSGSNSNFAPLENIQDFLTTYQE